MGGDINEKVPHQLHLVNTHAILNIYDNFKLIKVLSESFLNFK